MPTVPSRTSKRGDDYEPVTGTCSDENGPADLRGGTLRFIGKTDINGVPLIIDSATDDGECVNVEDETDNVADRGRYRFEPTIAGVSQSGVYEVEVEATMANGKKLTFPSKAAENPTWQIDPDLA